MNGLPDNVLQYIEKELKISSPDPWVMFDRVGKITYMNEATIRATGRTREELIGTPFADCFTDPDKLHECVILALKKGTLQDCELAIKGRDRTETILAYNISVYKDQNGLVAGYFATGRDVTDRKKTQQELKETINWLQAYTYRINHMLETMLEQISEKKTSVVILDMSGLPNDVEVSDDQVNIAKSARQLGSTCIVTGVKSESVNKLTEISVKLSPLTTEQSPKNGLGYTIAIAEEES